MPRSCRTISITHLLSRWQTGDSDAFAELVERLEGELKRKAVYVFSKERREQTLQPTALVNEAYLRLAESSHLDWNSRAHFLAAAATTMERILVDKARRRNAVKRGSGVTPITLEALTDRGPASDPKVLETIAVHEALENLSKLAMRQAQVARYRCFAGMNHAEIAEVLGVTERTVKNDWRRARLFLEHALAPASAPSEPSPCE